MTLLDGLRLLLAGVMMVAGVMHFVAPRTFEKMVPSYLPWSRALVAVSGVCEIALAVLLLVPQTRWYGAIGLMALLLAVFPANVHVALQQIPMAKKPVPPWMLWARLGTAAK